MKRFVLAVVAIQFFVLGRTAWGAELYDINRTSVRALGMGNAFVSVVNGHDSLFYNPAGIAQNGGVNWRIFDLVAGAVDVTALETLLDFQDSDSFADTIRELYGENVWASAHVKTSVMLPFVTAAFYDTLDVSMRVDNPAIPEIELNAINDMGLALGFGAPVLPLFHVGGVVKRIDRRGTRTTYGASTLATLDPDPIVEDFETRGTGYSLDLGANLAVPGPVSPAFSFVWRNVGTTKFRTSGSQAPPSDPDEMIIGASLGLNAGLVEIRPSFDYRYLNRSDVQISKKINFGVEVDLPIIDVRAGFHQGYYTAGGTFSMGLIDIDFATYGVEMGEYAGQKEDRRYLVSLSLGLGIDLGLGASGRGGSGSGSSGSSSRGGFFGGGGRLKQRR